MNKAHMRHHTDNIVAKATETQKHTPGQLSVGAAFDLYSTTMMPDAGGKMVRTLIATMRQGKRHENARRLALCWNTHDELVAALIEAEKNLPEHNPQYPAFDLLDECPPDDPRGCGACELRQQVHAAIAKATT